MGVRDMERLLQQWQMDSRDLRRRMMLTPTPRERERWYSLWLLAQGWTASAPRRRPWQGIPTPSVDGPPPSARAVGQP